LSEIRDLDKLNPELALGDDELAGMRVLDLPSDLDESDDQYDADQQGESADSKDLLEEEEAIALAKRPLDEILGLGQFGGVSHRSEEDLSEPDSSGTEHH